MSDEDPFATLGLRSDAEDVVITAAYRALAQRYHPDKWRGDSKTATEKMVALNLAYQKLSDPAYRAARRGASPNAAHGASSEETLFDYEGVKITSRRIVVDSKTFAVQNILQASGTSESPALLLPILIILGGLVNAFDGSLVGFVVALSAGGYLVYKVKRPMLYITLQTSSGEVVALRTYQRKYQAAVLSALNEAILRGGI